MESRRQQKVASAVQETLGEIFRKYGPDYYGRAFVTITQVKITPDLSVVRVYVSIFNVEDKLIVLSQMRQNVHEIRKQLGTRMRHQLRRVPEMEFFLDDSLDEVFKIDSLLKDIKKKDDDTE